MLLMSWNVAGWATTLERIRADFGANAGVAVFLEKHGVDIMCLQARRHSVHNINDIDIIY